jgi:hypothetical protein
VGIGRRVTEIIPCPRVVAVCSEVRDPKQIESALSSYAVNVSEVERIATEFQIARGANFPPGRMVLCVSPEQGKWPPGRSNLRVIHGQQDPDRRNRRRGWSPWICVAFVSAHFAIRFPLDSWLNAASDFRFAVALVLSILPLLLAAYALYRSVFPQLHR